MGIELTTVLLFGGLILLLAMGVPVVFALGGISVLITLLLDGTSGLYIVATTTYREITDPGLITIPLFLLMGNFLIHSGISDRLFKALNIWLSGLRGGLAIVSVGVCGPSHVRWVRPRHSHDGTDCSPGNAQAAL